METEQQPVPDVGKINRQHPSVYNQSCLIIWAQGFFYAGVGPTGPGGGLGLIFAGYVPLASQSAYPIIAYFLANYRPHLSHFLENVIFVIPT